MRMRKITVFSAALALLSGGVRFGAFQTGAADAVSRIRVDINKNDGRKASYSKNAENRLLKEGASDTFKVGNASFKLSNGGSEGGNVTGANNKKLQLQGEVYPRMTMDGAKVLFIHFSLTALHSRLLRATDVLQEAAEAATFTMLPI